MAVQTRKHVTIQFKDATGSPLTRTIGPGPGDFTFDGLEASNVEALPILDRGTFLELVVVVHTEDVLVTVTRGAVTNTYLLNNCRTVAKFTEAKEGNTWSFSGVCYEGITRT